MDDITKARLKKEREKALGSINWEALGKGHAQSFDEGRGVYTGAEDFVEQKNADIVKRLERKKRL